MEIYLEIIEKLSPQEELTELPQMLRFLCDSEDDARKKYEQLKPQLTITHYTAYIHFHNHEEGKPCKVVIIDKK